MVETTRRYATVKVIINYSLLRHEELSCQRRWRRVQEGGRVFVLFAGNTFVLETKKISAPDIGGQKIGRRMEA